MKCTNLSLYIQTLDEVWKQEGLGTFDLILFQGVFGLEISKFKYSEYALERIFQSSNYFRGYSGSCYRIGIFSQTSNAYVYVYK